MHEADEKSGSSLGRGFEKKPKTETTYEKPKEVDWSEEFSKVLLLVNSFFTFISNFMINLKEEAFSVKTKRRMLEMVGNCLQEVSDLTSIAVSKAKKAKVYLGNNVKNMNISIVQVYENLVKIDFISPILEKIQHIYIVVMTIIRGRKSIPRKYIRIRKAGIDSPIKRFLSP